MATTTYEEEKKRVERPAALVMPTYAPPTNTATQQAQAEADAFYNELRQRYAQAADPAVQAAQDARIQRGRQFWTGANLYANLIANAINANGTANGAPNMTWNDASTQKMYETWKNADARLRADRKEAQQRYDAMGLQQQQMRLAAAQAQDRADLDAYKTQFGLDKDAAVAKYNADMDEYKTQRGWQHDDEVYEKKLADAREDAKTNYQRQLTLTNIRHSGGSKKDNKERSTKYDSKVGGMTIMADNQNERNYNMYSLANDMYEYYSSLTDEQKKKILGDDYSKVKELGKSQFAQRKFVEDYLQRFYENDPAFRGYIEENYGDVIDFGEQPEQQDPKQPQKPKHWMDREFDPSKPYPGYLTKGSAATQVYKPNQKTTFSVDLDKI